MRITYVDQGDDGEPILVKMTDEEVLAEYYPHWCRLMLRAGKLLEVTPEKCIDDYIVVHWATID